MVVVVVVTGDLLEENMFGKFNFVGEWTRGSAKLKQVGIYIKWVEMSLKGSWEQEPEFVFVVTS